MQDPIPPDVRRAAEERYVARFEKALKKTMELPPDRRSGPRRYDPIWPLEDGRIRCTEAFQGIFVEEVRLEGSFPDSVAVIVFRFFLRPQCHFALEWGIWTLERLLEPEPWYDDCFVVNLGEWLAKDFKHEQYDCRPGETIRIDRAGSWSMRLPRIASGEVDYGPEIRALAVRAMEALQFIPPDA